MTTLGSMNTRAVNDWSFSQITSRGRRPPAPGPTPEGTRRALVLTTLYDGWRMLAHKRGDVVRLVSRNGREHTKRFPEIVQALTKLKPKTLTLDGEVVVFDAELVSRFGWLRHLNHRDLATPPMFMAFDLLHLAERDYRAEPLKVRRRALEKLVRRT